MANMSYCRFENTYHDLEDCFENMDDPELSASEKKFRDKLIELCRDFAENGELLLDEEEPTIAA